jgi:hypothetical protein
VTKPRRRPMTLARKRRIHAQHVDASGVGRCGQGCGTAVPVAGEGVIYEHVVPFWMDPSKDDDGPNVQPWCPACSAAKNRRGGDPTTIAKTKRQLALAVDKPPPGQRKPPGKIKGGAKLPGKGQGAKLRGRGFDKGPSRPINSRGFR